MTNVSISVLLALSLIACGAGTYSPRLHPVGPGHESVSSMGVDQRQCDSWTAQARGWGASAAFAAGLAGSGGIGVASAQTKSQGVQIGIGVGVAVLSAWAILSSYLSSSYASQRSAECASTTPPIKP